MSFRLIALLLASSLWLLTGDRDATTLSAQVRGTDESRGLLSGGPAGRRLRSPAVTGGARPVSLHRRTSGRLRARRTGAIELDPGVRCCSSLSRTFRWRKP